MRFPQNHNVVQALSPDGADEAFDVCVLPWRSRCCWSVADAHGRQPSRYGETIGGISVADEVLRRLFPGEGLGDLTGDPFGRRIGRDIDPDQVASLEPDDHLSIPRTSSGLV